MVPGGDGAVWRRFAKCPICRTPDFFRGVFSARSFPPGLFRGGGPTRDEWPRKMDRPSASKGGRFQGRAVPRAAVLPKPRERFARRPVSRVLSACCHAGRPFLCDASRNAPDATNPNDGAGMPFLVARKREAAVPIRSCSRWGLPCRPCCQGRGALLPHRFALACGSRTLAQAVCFLWHCPWGRPRRPLAGTVFPWSPDFPLLLSKQRPSSRLASAGHGRAGAPRQASSCGGSVSV